MLYSQIEAQTGFLSQEEVKMTLSLGLASRFSGQKVLVLIPDHTRTLPLPMLFRLLVDLLADAKKVSFMVALGTHPALSESHLLQLVGISQEERQCEFAHIGLLNHAWDDPDTLISLGLMDHDEIRTLAGKDWHPSLPGQVDIRINKAVLEYDQVLIIGPTFPHEVVGFSGGAKYLFPGISGPDMINATHWLGALAGVVNTIGVKNTPVRSMIHAAARRLQTPVTLVSMVLEGHDLVGMYVGDLLDAWSHAADLSAIKNIYWSDKPYKKVLSWAPAMYDELWTGAKAMYKLEPAVAVGGEVIIYAPHLEVVSHVHGKYIYEIGYHTLPYFLNDWDKFKHIPLGVLAHSTHMRGSGEFENGVEKPNVRVTLASKISREDCEQLNLGYMDPAKIDLDSFKGREDEGVLFVPRAGETLYRVRSTN